MTIVLESLLAFILVYKYAALFVITFVAAFFLPLPASTTLVAASAFAFQGYFSFPAVFGIALLGNIAGDNLGFFISKKYGEELLRLIGFKKILTSPNFHMLKEYTKTNTASLIFVWLQLFVINAICFYCMVSAATSTLLFILGIILWKKLKNA